MIVTNNIKLIKGNLKVKNSKLQNININILVDILYFIQNH